ncbi:MAG: hypothetical protein A2033_07445 [Bacteroidetes bacterium GWA2_31_9]|nr:MAG: hypothetical protein A2033_07445 [Bacteroidetes bacterium GWA2_31_9]
MNNLKFDYEPVIYTTGAFLKPLKVIDSQDNEKWVWFVSEFTDDSYFNGDGFNPHEFANSKEVLISISE